MKKTIRIMALVMALVMLCGMLAACGNVLSGTYSNGIGGDTLGGKVSYTFSGKKVTISATVSLIVSSTAEFEGEYEISEAADGTKNITFSFEDADASKYSGSFAFAEGKDEENGAYISIGGIKYYKVK